MAQGIGSLMGALGAAGWATERGQGRLLVAGAVGLGLGVSVFALSRTVALSLPALWLAGVGGSTFSVSVQSSIQLLVPDEFRGRVMAVWSMTHSSVRPVGELWFGMAAAVLTAPVALSVSGAAVLVFALLIALPRRGLRTLRVGVEH
jgi:MFS family permease